MVELIITEKPKSAQRIAEALAEGKPLKRKEKKVSYYEITRGSEDIIVACAVGHLFGIAKKKPVKKKTAKKKSSKKKTVKKKSRFFEVEWQPLYKINKESAFSKNYYDTIKKLSKKADSFTVSCDLDIEGELIGMNILKYICKRENGRRMKFSTLTKEDLVKAYKNASESIEWGMAIAGDTRHRLDFYYGINLSNALTNSIKKAGMFRMLSIGRVQGPALKIIVEKEKDIGKFVPKPYWQIECDLKIKSAVLKAVHEKDKIWDEKEAEEIFGKINGKDGKVEEVKKRESSQKPPVPFDLTTLQTEAYRHFGITPKVTLSVAQDLYTAGAISYPRTSSQQLPESIGYGDILKKLQKNKEYEGLCEKLLKLKQLTPNNGKKTDPAHPAIYPTGVKPKLKELNQKIYDLAVRRFLAVFGEPAVRESVKISVDVEGESFSASGTTTKEKGWFEFYGPYAKQKEEEMPDVKKGDEAGQENSEMLSKETAPPPRFTPASIVRELEKRDLGTKATRADVIETLYQRGYIEDKSITATGLGMKTVETLEKYVPDVVDEALTRQFEQEMEGIMSEEGGHDRMEEESGRVLTKARTELNRILDGFDEKEKEIGENLLDAARASYEKANKVGKCLSCREGSLMIRPGKFGRFIGCTSYPECTETYKLPSSGMIKPTEEFCGKCEYPVITVIRKRKGPQNACINLDCPEKVLKMDFKEDQKCEKCGEGKIVLRKSIYGQFLSCDNFPKCRNIIKDEKAKSDQ